jgi:chemotaxis family two-component system response regulator Rcp1
MSPIGLPVEILLVEDNLGDTRLTREALKDCKLLNTLHHVEDGVEAMAFLRREGPYAAAPRPDLILLDLNLPRMGGREVLAAIKEDEALKGIPVIILTTSDDEQDVLGAYQSHANCFITKPIALERFLEVVRSIEAFWLSIVRLPPNGQRGT